MKKVLITAIVIVALGIGAFLIGENFIFSSNPIPVTSNNDRAVKENNSVKKIDENQGEKENINNKRSNSSDLVNKKNSTDNNINSNNISNVESKNSNNLNNTNSNNTNNNVNTNNTNSNNTSSSNKSSNEKGNGAITYSIPTTNNLEEYPQSSVIVTNNTGNNISSEQLNKYMRNWIMIGQNNCAGICDATGTYWEQPWLDKVPESVLVQAFVDANGQLALSKNITAGEFVKATVELDRLTAKDVPFTMDQAKKLIISMITKDGYATASEITKITLNQGSPSYYTVYTKESGTWPFWTVIANTGYAHG